ncbi:MAG: hypothetical protein Q8Q60_01885 [Candidatus Chromulinivorax sp.]|nr:hypothetical protein [Candidatus Chromulinivorax sp.]
MKTHKIFFISLLVCSSLITHARSSQSYNQDEDEDSGSYIFNFTGKPIILNFYTKSFGELWVDSATVGPLALVGGRPNDFLSTVTTTLLPSKVNMHNATSSFIRFEGLKLNSKLKDKSIHGVKIPTPKMISFNYDYKVTLVGDRIVVTRMNTIAGIPIPGKKASDIDQWPSKKDLAIYNMTSADRIIALEEQNTHLAKEVISLKDKEKRYRNDNKKEKQSNRKKMKESKKKKIEENKKTISRLQSQIAAEAEIITPTENSLDEDIASNDITQGIYTH